MSLTFVICVEYVFGANLVHCAKCKKNVLGLYYGLSCGASIGLSCGLSIRRNVKLLILLAFFGNCTFCKIRCKMSCGLSGGLSGRTSIGLSCGQHHLSSRIISFQHHKYTIYTERTLFSPVQFSVFSITNKEELFG